MHEDGRFHRELMVSVEKPALAMQILLEDRMSLSEETPQQESFHLELTSWSTSAGSVENIISHEGECIWTRDHVQHNIHDTMNLRNV